MRIYASVNLDTVIAELVMALTTPKKIRSGCNKLTALLSFVRAAATRFCALRINVGKAITDVILPGVMSLQAQVRPLQSSAVTANSAFLPE